MVTELDAVLRAWGLSSEEALAWARCAARALPVAALLPALGFGPAATPVRVAFVVVFATAVRPTLGPVASNVGPSAAIAHELALGLPVALVAAATIWTAFMAGNLSGDALGPASSLRRPVTWVFGLLASIAFLEVGGAAAVAEQLAGLSGDAPPWSLAAETLVRGVGVAVLVATPLLVTGALTDVVLALATRVDPVGALSVGARVARPLILALCAALLLERVFELVVGMHP